MNAVALAWPTAYNVICEFLGANWYALIASAGLAALFILHIIYALWLTVQNRKARGNDRYAVNAHYPGVEWSSKNMLVLGIVILAFLVVHLIQFWAKMQLQEILGHEYSTNGVTYAPQFGTLFIQVAFKQVWTPIVYIIGFVALWFHMNHGFWSMLHTVGFDNDLWIKRLKCIGLWWTSIVVGLFIAQAIVFTVQAHKDHYTNDPELQAQYAEHWINKSNVATENLLKTISELGNTENIDPQVAQATYDQAISKFMEEFENIHNKMQEQCPAAMYMLQDSKGVEIYGDIVRQARQQEQYMQMQQMQLDSPEGLEFIDETEVQ